MLLGVYAFEGPQIILKSSFIDSEGRQNVIGTVRNYGQLPVQVIVGVQASNGKTYESPTYGRVIWPLTDSPFKIILDKGITAGEPFLREVKEVYDVPNYNTMLVLNYSSMAVGEERAFMGTISNTGPFEVYNVSVFAGIHSPDHKFQLDAVRSNIIPVIRPGEEVEFSALPDPTIKSDMFYYSCAGLDYDNPITTIRAGEGTFISYALTAVAQISNIRYDNATDSITFGVRPYPPDGTTVGIKLAQLSQNQTVAVLLDGNPHEASVNGDGKTLSIEFFVPRGDHEVQIQGVRNVPEFSFAIPALLAVVTGGMVILARIRKTAFKIS
ncbi:MAG TPA: hypothetical protein VNI77_10045 [Nitrososphaera sp.]|nr:hypothetical protein [Nitrososphaera sp.]